MDVEFDATSTAEFGLRFRRNGDEETVLRCDTRGARLILDRTRSGQTGFHPGFSGTYEAPVRSINRRIRLRLWVDISSVEVMANEGEPAITALILPGAESQGMEFFGANGSGTIHRLEFWPMRSAWK
jgi:fructan beta-fructosidase